MHRFNRSLASVVRTDTKVKGPRSFRAGERDQEYLGNQMNDEGEQALKREKGREAVATETPTLIKQRVRPELQERGTLFPPTINKNT